jgi:hypothetical protein
VQINLIYTVMYSTVPARGPAYVALYAQAPPSTNVQIFVERIGGPPESHRIQWIGHYAFSRFLLNHPFIILEIGVLIFNARCKKQING